MTGHSEPFQKKSLAPDPRLLSTSGLASHFELRWYALYTRANHERAVADQLRDRQLEHYLPQYESLRRWKDRTVRLHLPLFPGYLFVRLPLLKRLTVQQIPGVVQFVGFGGSPTEISESELYQIREVLSGGFRAEPHPFLRVGRRVRVRSGPLAGLEGILVRRKNRARLVISIELIVRSVAVEMDEADLEAF
jgi:transcription antitermination factor NusG